jgi:hypothetical protein
LKWDRNKYVAILFLNFRGRTRSPQAITLVERRTEVKKIEQLIVGLLHGF